MNPEQIKNDIKKLESYRVITSDELKSFLNDVANVLTKWKSATFALNKETKDTLNLIVKQVNAEHDRILKDVETSQQGAKSDVTREMAECIAMCKSIAEKISTIKPVDGIDGEDGEDGVDGKDGKDGSPDTAKEIKDKLETLTGNKRLDKSAIKGLDKMVTGEDLDRAISILDQRSQYLINKTVKHDATLTGSGTDADPLSVVNSSSVTFYPDSAITPTINGANKVFNFTNTITSALVLFLAGQPYQPTIDFTVTGAKQITMTNAPDSSLSGQPMWLLHT